jgi:hypothetical protein
MSFISRALEISEKAYDATEHTIEEWNTNRHASRLLLKLGVAVYAEQRLGGDHAAVERVLAALDGHAAEHGEVDLDHLKAAREVLGPEFSDHHPDAAAQSADAAPAAS